MDMKLYKEHRATLNMVCPKCQSVIILTLLPARTMLDTEEFKVLCLSCDFESEKSSDVFKVLKSCTYGEMLNGKEKG